MKRSDLDIASTIKDALNSQEPPSPFGRVWIDANKKSIHFSKRYIIPLIAILMCLTFFSVGFATGILRQDKVDYPFVNDPDIIGKWKAVDFVYNKSNFNPKYQTFKGETYITELVFVKGGTELVSIRGGNLYYSPQSWTKDRLLNDNDKTASDYEIKEIDGKTYMFMQWKSGDYIFRGREPQYYVLEKVDSEDYSNYEPKVINEDKIDYPFVMNKQMLGTWEAVDFVDYIGDFKPKSKNWPFDLYLKSLKLMKDGTVTSVCRNRTDKDNITWTEDLIIDKADKTASKCTIKEIDGDTYMFYEWKSGDYTYRGETPAYYYVLKKD
jgi:bla regulator protein BlaR1